MSPSRAQTRTESITSLHVGSHAHHTPPQMRTGGRDVPHILIHPLRHSTLTNARSHALATRARFGSPAPVSWPSHHLPLPTPDQGPGDPKFPFPLGALRHPKLPGFGRHCLADLGSPATCPSPPQTADRAPSHLAADAAARGTPDSASLLWRRGPRSRRRRRCRRVLRGGTPGGGAGPLLPDSRSGHWLTAAAPPRPIAARGRASSPGGLGGTRAGLGVGFDRRRPARALRGGQPRRSAPRERLATVPGGPVRRASIEPGSTRLRTCSPSGLRQDLLTLRVRFSPLSNGNGDI
jgi:hypothetical protein